MVSKINLLESRRQYEIDDDCVAILREHKDFLRKEHSTALDTTYVHMRPFLDVTSPYQDNEIVARAKVGHLHYWDILLKGRFDDEFEKSLVNIFKMRNQLGLEARFFMASYSARVLEAIALRLPAKPL